MAWPDSDLQDSRREAARDGSEDSCELWTAAVSVFDYETLVVALSFWIGPGSRMSVRRETEGS